MMKPTFEVDRKGLGKILARRGIQFAVLELLQNAFDENTTEVLISLAPTEVRGTYCLSVLDDNPTGFADLTHAYTLFAESKKKGDPEKRGRFNLGEKLVIAVAKRAKISTTTGTVYFEPGGRRETREKRMNGSLVEVDLRLTKEELQDVRKAIGSVIPPRNVRVEVKLLFPDALLHFVVRPGEPIATFRATLPTEIADDEGYLRPTQRQTNVEVYEVEPGDVATIYEMGIPVVETGDTYHVNILQKVPLNMDRDNVTPGYLRRLRTEVLEATRHLLTREVANQTWVTDALNSNDVSEGAVQAIVKQRFGDKVVVQDPSDPEGTKLAVAQGYTVIPAGSFNKDQWSNIRRAGAALPAGKVTPSNSKIMFSSSPDAKDVTYPREKWTRGMRLHVLFAKRLGEELLRGRVYVDIVNDFGRGYGACFGDGQLLFNVAGLGKEWFSQNPLDEKVLELLVHEFGHHYSEDHLSSKYHDALCKLGARLGRFGREGGLDRIFDETTEEVSS